MSHIESYDPTLAVPRVQPAGQARPHTALDDSERELSVLTAVLRSVSCWEGFEQGSERLLRELASALGQTAAAFWLPRGEVLVARAVWSMQGADGGVPGAHMIPRGVGLAGRAWERREAIDRAPVGSRELASQAGAFAPTVAVACTTDGQETLGVVELYSSARLEFSSHLMRVLTGVGRHLGAFLGRRRAELGHSPLSAREVEVLRAAADGSSVRDIALSLNVTSSTVKTHLEHIYKKLAVSGRAAAVAHGLRSGLIQ